MDEIFVNTYEIPEKTAHATVDADGEIQLSDTFRNYLDNFPHPLERESAFDSSDHKFVLEHDAKDKKNEYRTPKNTVKYHATLRMLKWNYDLGEFERVAKLTLFKNPKHLNVLGPRKAPKSVIEFHSRTEEEFRRKGYSTILKGVMAQLADAGQLGRGITHFGTGTVSDHAQKINTNYLGIVKDPNERYYPYNNLGRVDDASDSFFYHKPKSQKTLDMMAKSNLKKYYDNRMI